MNLPRPLSSFDYPPIRENDCQIYNPVFHRSVAHGICATVLHNLVWGFLGSIKIVYLPAISRDHSSDLGLYWVRIKNLVAMGCNASIPVGQDQLGKTVHSLWCPRLIPSRTPTAVQQYPYCTGQYFIIPNGTARDNKLFWVKGNNLAHVEKVNTYTPERCREMTLDTGSARIWD